MTKRAKVMNDPKKYLLLITFGPIQGFIGRSRKLRDLFNASTILSDLATKTIEAVVNQGFSMLNPWVNSRLDHPLPNRILAEISAESSAAVLPKAQAIEKSLDAAFISMNSIVLKNIIKQPVDANFPDNWKEQVGNHLEINWVVREQTENFKEDYIRINKDLAGVKNEKQTKQFVEQGLKCRLEADKNALIYRQRKKETPLKDINKNAIAVDLKDLNPGEGLSAIGALKRFYSRDGFDSTAAFALRHIKRQLDGSEELKNFTELLPKTTDDQLFYPENQNERYCKKQGIEGVDINQLKTAYYALKDKVRENNLHFHNHYAVLVFDGDDAGKWLSGEIGTEIADLKAYQLYVSKLLGNFADAVKKLVNGENGLTIYAGGDDFVGLLHLENLFGLLQKIRTLFDTTVNNQLKESEYQTRKDFNISAGVVIAHYSETLGQVIEFARSLEQKSKKFARSNIDTKNALTLGIVTRSAHGITTDLTFSWKQLANVSALFPFFQKRTKTTSGTYPPIISNNLLTQLMGSINHYSLNENTSNPDELNKLKILVQSALPHFITQAYNGPKNDKSATIASLSTQTSTLLESLNMGEYIRLIQFFETLARHTCPAASIPKISATTQKIPPAV